jgi:rod shape-determining protein MreC
MGYERGQHKRRLIWIALLALFAILFLHYTRLGAPVENLFIRAIQPLQNRLYPLSQSAQTQNGADYSSLSRNQLMDRLAALEKENTEAAVEISHFQTLVDETRLLEKQVDFLKERSFQAVTARVTSRSTEQLSQSLMINRGKSDGLQEGFPVIIEHGIVIGTVRNVDDYAAEVLLMTSYDSRMSGRVQNDAQSPGVVRGEHNLSLSMEFIPQLDVVSVGDTVVTNGADPTVPQGLVLGRVQEVFNEKGSLFQQASLTPLFEASDVFIVSVLLP